MRLRRLGRVAVRDAALLGDPAHDRLVAVGLVDAHDVLQDRGGALDAHAGVDVLLRQRRQLPVRMQLELHEDEVPELEEALAAGAARLAVGLTAAVLDAPVVVHLGVRAARPRAADRPEVFRRGQQDDPLDRLADLLPLVVRDLVLAEPQLRVAREDADPEAFGIELQVIEDELPREIDRALFEVLAEREVAEHLEEGEVGAVEADLVDVGRAEALLHRRQQRCRRLLSPEEERHQRLHPRGREQCGAVVGARNQRRGRAEGVALRLEESAEARAQLGCALHPWDCRDGGFRRPCAPRGSGGGAAAGRRWSDLAPRCARLDLVLLGRDLLADLLQRTTDQARHVHLRDADLLRDL